MLSAVLLTRIKQYSVLKTIWSSFLVAAQDRTYHSYEPAHDMLVLITLENNEG